MLARSLFFALAMGATLPATAQDLGEQVYTKNCVACHGVKGGGDGPAAKAMNPRPRNLRDGDFQRGGSREEIFSTISFGIPGTGMPPWKDALTESERWAVVDYVRSVIHIKSNKEKR